MDGILKGCWVTLILALFLAYFIAFWKSTSFFFSQILIKHWSLWVSLTLHFLSCFHPVKYTFKQLEPLVFHDQSDTDLCFQDFLAACQKSAIPWVKYIIQITVLLLSEERVTGQTVKSSWRKCYKDYSDKFKSKVERDFLALPLGNAT